MLIRVIRGNSHLQFRGGAVQRLKPPLRSCAHFRCSSFTKTIKNQQSSIGNRQSYYHPSAAPAGAGIGEVPGFRWLAPPANLRCASGTEIHAFNPKSEIRIHHSELSGILKTESRILKKMRVRQWRCRARSCLDPSIYPCESVQSVVNRICNFRGLSGG